MLTTKIRESLKIPALLLCPLRGSWMPTRRNKFTPSFSLIIRKSRRPIPTLSQSLQKSRTKSQQVQECSEFSHKALGDLFSASSKTHFSQYKKIEKWSNKLIEIFAALERQKKQHYLGLYDFSFRYSNEPLSVKIYAHTDGNQLNYWWPKIEFNNEYLRYNRATKANMWEDLKFPVSKDEANAAGDCE